MSRFLLTLLLLSLALPVFADDQADALSMANSLFAAMAAHDGDKIRSAFVPGGRIVSLRADGTLNNSSAEDFATRIGGAKNDMVERFTGPASVKIEGSIAQVWAPYEFLLDGKFHHCGIDAFDLLKTSEGWKIASVVYTNETKSCPPSK